MKLRLFILTLFITTLSFAQSKGTISGVITDKDSNNETLPFANVFVKGTKINATTDIDGKYSINIAPGSYVIQYTFVGYEPKEVPVKVTEGAKLVINQELSSGAYALEDVVIKSTFNREKETAILLEQKKAVEIKQSIGAQEMSRKGISNVEQGVSKISGISKVADRGIFVRGLDDRYNYLQINGLNIAPSDPNLKTIPLNYIPSDVVRNIDVFKTYNTNLYQDFAGASINVITKDVSSNATTKISISTGMNTNTTFKDFKTTNEGAHDFFGYNANSRNLPSVFGKNIRTGYTASPTESKDLFNSSWSPENTKAPLLIGTNIFHSQSHSLKNDKKWGYLFNANFSNNFLSQEGKRRNLNSEGFATKDFDRNVYQNTTQKSFLGSFNLKKTDKYNFALNLIYFHNSENTVDEVRGDNTDFITTDRPFFLRDIKFTENATYSIQQLGTLYFKDKKHTLDYGIAASLGKNEMPDRKTLLSEGEGENAEYITFNGADPFRFYSELENFNVNGKLSYEIKWKENEDGVFKNALKFGYNGDMTSYDFFQRTIRIFGGSGLTDTTLNTNDPQAFFDNAFNSGSLSYRSTADPTYKVEISQFINAGYINYNKNWNKFILDLGLRVEYLFRETTYRTEETDFSKPSLKLEYDPLDFSPVVNLKYMPSDRTNIRFTASRTSTKPRFREILPFRYSDGDGNFAIGNEKLINTTNYNGDLKYEIFPTPTSLFSATAFAKYIENPISRLLTGTSTGFLTSYDNFESATLFGLELETSIGLDNFFKDSDFAKRFNIGFNTILMKSKEEADKAKFPQLTNTSRSLQGASDFIINADIAYEIIKNDRTESKINLIFNTFSERIYAVGVDRADDIKEQPINMLDFTWRTTFNKKYQLNFSAKNILNQKFNTTQDATRELANPATYSNINQQLSLGTNIGLEFSYTF
ncbi:MAG: hypothetical protein B7Y83_12955 [Flavobacteriales bacterium 32-34-25]|nr:MAG: hypothetical protein B7Y83_12955 [Flavobacteriales bacterium 32-34-25]